MNNCDQCGSYAINHHSHGRDGSEPYLCDVCFWRKRHDALEAELAKLREGQEPVAWVVETANGYNTIGYLSSVVNRLSHGTKLYAAPQPVSDDAKDALVEGLETIALESTDEQARCCAHHYLAAYRAAQEKK